MVPIAWFVHHLLLTALWCRPGTDGGASGLLFRRL